MPDDPPTEPSLAALMAALPLFRAAGADPRPAPATPYGEVLHEALDVLFEAYPVFATEVGYHLLDDRWGDPGEASRQRLLARLRGLVEAARALPEADLSAAERIDRGILVEALEGAIFDEAVLREAAWDPLGVVQVAGSGLFELIARETTPWPQRGLAFTWRVARLAGYLDAAAAALGGLPGRPVSRLHTETALAQLDGIMEQVDEGLTVARASADGGLDLAAHLEAIRPHAEAAVETFRRHLADDIMPRAQGEGRLGPELFREKLRHTLASDLGPEEVEARARRDYNVVRAELVRLARLAWPTWRPDAAMPDDEDALVRGVLDAVATEHGQPDRLLDDARAEVARIEAFVRDRGLISLPDEPLEITWTPTFMRPYGGAFLSPPGPLEVGQRSYFWITPPGDDWPPERLESFLREDNERMQRLLCIHEAIPGHYLQLAAAGRSPNLTRSIFQSGMFAEGWAVYVTQVMMDAGYGGHEPALLLNHWKFYLRAIINALLDVAIHTGGMTEAEAMDLMVHGGFQEEQEARAKWLRARLTATQLSTYYMGSLEFWDLELAARRRAAEAAGAGAHAVPESRLVGDYGVTPGFDQRAHLEAVISHGAPPIKWVRRLVLGA
ncbi:MAG TPA: DUF885 domain-containing protein [Candidatus Sulfotelmatobacter sp.]|nr:DUF885 domain-containing protein [Candidatus Sulfotelmatobacter sp.]